MFWRRFQDWRDRRQAFGALKHLQRDAETVLASKNDNPLVLAQLSLNSNLTEAEAHWERARVLMPNTVLRSPDALEILLELKRYDEADALMRERGKRFPRDYSYLTALAQIAERRGDIEEALTRWRLVRLRVPDTTYGYHGCARALMALGRLDEADAEWAAALRRNRDNLEANSGRAMISNRKKDWAESAERWNFTAETFSYPPAFAYHGRALIEMGRLDEAEAYLARAAHNYPSDLEIAETRSQLAQRRGDLATACDRWMLVRSIRPSFPAGYHEGARRLFETDRHAEADEVLRAAIDRFPDDVWPLRDFARLAHDRRDWNEAADRWAALRQRFPNESMGFSLGAEALKSAGRHEEAAALN